MTLRSSLLALLAAAAAMAQTTTTTSTRSSSFPAVGLASSETAQVNVTNLATASSGGTAASCAGSISFVNAAGSTIGSATNFTVTGGQTFSKTLPYATTAASGRTVVRAVVSLTTSSGSTAPCALNASFETFDTTTGVTHVYLTGAAEAGLSISGAHGR